MSEYRFAQYLETVLIEFYQILYIHIDIDSLPPGKFFHAFLLSADFFKITFFEKFFQEYHQSVKQIGSNLFAKVISRQH